MKQTVTSRQRRPDGQMLPAREYDLDFYRGERRIFIMRGLRSVAAAEEMVRRWEAGATLTEMEVLRRKLGVKG